MALSHADRSEAAALITRMTEQGDSFDAADARRLVALLPVKPLAGFSFRVSKTTTTHASAGSGGVVEESNSEDIVAIGEEHPLRLGPYEVEHRRGRVDIRGLPLGAEVAQLRYDRSSGEPLDMRISASRSYSLFSFTFAITTMKHWKRPR